MSESGEARPSGGLSLRRKYQGVPLWLWVVGGTAVLTGVVVFIRNRHKGGADQVDDSQSTDTATGSQSPPYGNPISLVPVDQNGPGISADQVNSLATAINNLNGTLSKPPAGTPGGGSGNSTSVDAIIPGPLNFKWTQRDLARALLPESQRSDANAVERELGLLHKYNPTWITSGPHATRPLGGHRFKKPVTT